MSEKADIGRHLVGACRKGFKRIEEVQIQLAGIGLSRKMENACKAKCFGDRFLEFFDFVPIAFKKREERALGPRRPFYPEEGQLEQEPLPFFGIEEKIVEPESGPLSNGGRLRALLM